MTVMPSLGEVDGYVRGIWLGLIISPAYLKVEEQEARFSFCWLR